MVRLGRRQKPNGTFEHDIAKTGDDLMLWPVLINKRQ
jgi:hypothetical protein